MPSMMLGGRRDPIASSWRAQARHPRLSISTAETIHDLFPIGNGAEGCYPGPTNGRKGCPVSIFPPALRGTVHKPDVRVSRIRLSDWLHGNLTTWRLLGGIGVVSTRRVRLVYAR
jgi:hypothetical protein